jgi:hypothetical protein
VQTQKHSKKRTYRVPSQVARFLDFFIPGPRTVFDHSSRSNISEGDIASSTALIHAIYREETVVLELLRAIISDTEVLQKLKLKQSTLA